MSSTQTPPTDVASTTALTESPTFSRVCRELSGFKLTSHVTISALERPALPMRLQRKNQMLLQDTTLSTHSAHSLKIPLEKNKTRLQKKPVQVLDIQVPLNMTLPLVVD